MLQQAVEMNKTLIGSCVGDSARSIERFADGCRVQSCPSLIDVRW